MIKIKSPTHATYKLWLHCRLLPWENLPEIPRSHEPLSPVSWFINYQNTLNSKIFWHTNQVINVLETQGYNNFFLSFHCKYFLVFFSNSEKIKTNFSTMFDCQHAQWGPWATSLANISLSLLQYPQESSNYLLCQVNPIN